MADKKVDVLAGKGSVADKLKKQREEKEKRLKEIQGHTIQPIAPKNK